MNNSVLVKFWGTRGSFPQSGSCVNFYGGKTSCVSISTSEAMIILDAGSGLIDLGESPEINQYQCITILLSHAHHDHIMGLPFFKPLWDQEKEIHLYCGTNSGFGGTKAVLETVFSPPYFPVPWSSINPKTTYTDFKIGTTWAIIPEIHIETISLNHPGGGSGYKVTIQGKKIVYLSDTDHNDGAFERFITFCKGADLLIYDATFTDEEHQQHSTWGHSTWSAGINIAKTANIPQVILFHHDPNHDDNFLRKMEKQAQELYPNSLFAYQGLTINL